MKKIIQTIIIIILILKFTLVSAAPLAYSPELLISRYASWGIDPDKNLASINLKESWSRFKKKKDIVVAVVDTGIQGDHPFLKNNIFVPVGKVLPTNFGLDFSSDKVSFTPTDAHGHGTHVAGIVKSVYPEVKILALKYYNPKASGQANLEATIKAIQYAVDQNVDVINYSGGGPEASIEELRVLKAAERKGILIIAAAGNERSNIDEKRNAYYPASYGLSNIITVGAHDDSLNIIPSSNFGKKSVDIAAPGYRIRSTIPGNGAGYMTGTSQATAFVTGVVALIKAKHPKMKYDHLKNIILSSSLKVRNFEGKILGSGKLDAGRALELADSVNEKLEVSPTRSVANN
jgi:subtilisin family serine protease